MTQRPTWLHHHNCPPVQSMLGPETSDQFTALSADATIATIKAGRGDRQESRGGAAATAGMHTAGPASSVASMGALSRARAQAAKPEMASDAGASADPDTDLPEVDEAENPDSVSSEIGELDPGMRGAKVDPAGDAVNSALQAVATTGDYGDELAAGRTSE